MTANENNRVNENWGFHINRTEFFRSSPAIPKWANGLQKQDWSELGLVVWDANIQRVAHLFASYALKILSKMKLENEWKTKGMIVGTPVYEIPLELKRERKKKNHNEIEEKKPTGKWVLTHQIALSSSQAQDFYHFLINHEGELQEIASAEEVERRRRLAKAYSILLKHAENNTMSDPPPAAKKKVLPTSIPEGKYLTFAQIAESCNESTRTVNRWVGKEGLACIEIPQVGKLVRVEDLNAFLRKKGKPLIELQD
jgi:hypothetical protein